MTQPQGVLQNSQHNAISTSPLGLTTRFIKPVITTCTFVAVTAHPTKAKAKKKIITARLPSQLRHPAASSLPRSTIAKGYLWEIMLQKGRQHCRCFLIHLLKVDPSVGTATERVNSGSKMPSLPRWLLGKDMGIFSSVAGNPTAPTSC